MSSQIKQIQAHYLPVEDRIMLKIHTDEKQVFHAWLTRRYLKLLLPVLQGQHPQTGDTLLKNKISSATNQNEVLMPAGDFEQAYQPPEDANFPLGDTPILLSQMTFRGFDTESPQLVLEPEAGSGIVLSYEPGFLNALLTLVQQAASQADWQFDRFIHQKPESDTLQ